MKTLKDGCIPTSPRRRPLVFIAIQWVAVWCLCMVSHAQPPDLTDGGVPANTRYINLGPTGLTGWVYADKDPKALLGDSNYTG